MDICAAKEAIIIYADHLRKKVGGIPDRIQFNKMNTEDMKPMANLMHMKYVLSNSFSVQPNTVEKVAYDHLIKMIDEIKVPITSNELAGTVIIDENYMVTKKEEGNSKSVESLIDVIQKPNQKKWSIF